MGTTDRQLVALHCTVWKAKRIVFRYKAGRWEVFELLRPWDIREALKVSLERIDDAVFGRVGKGSGTG